MDLFQRIISNGFSKSVRLYSYAGKLTEEYNPKASSK